MASQNSTSCGSYPVTFDAFPCSGNGACVYSDVFQRNVCQCNAGWRGNADYQTSNSLVSCQINIEAIIVLWSIVLSVMVILTLRCFRDLYLLNHFHSYQNSRLQAAGKRPVSMLANRAFAALLPFLCVGIPSAYTISIMRIVDQQRFIIGLEWSVSILWVLLRSSFFFSAMHFQPALIESLLKGQRACDELLRRNRFTATLVLVLAVVAMLPVVAPLTATPSSPFDFFWGRFAYVFNTGLLSLVMVLSIFQARFAMIKIKEVLIASYDATKDPRTLSIANELRSLQMTFIRQQIFQAFLMSFITCAPFMWNKHDYVATFTTFSAVVTVLQALHSVTKIQTSQSGQSTAGKTHLSPAGSSKGEALTTPVLERSASLDN